MESAAHAITMLSAAVSSLPFYRKNKEALITDLSICWGGRGSVIVTIGYFPLPKYYHDSKTVVIFLTITEKRKTNVMIFYACVIDVFIFIS